MKTAKLIRIMRDESGINQALYKVDPSIAWHSYVLASSISNEYAEETLLFGANPEGEIVDWSDLEGSMRGKVTHAVAFKSIGYEVVAD